MENDKIVTPEEPLTREQNIQLSRSFDFFYTHDQYMYDVAERYFDISRAEVDSICLKENTFWSYLLRDDLFSKMKAVYIPDGYRDIDDEPKKQSTYYDFDEKNENRLYNISDYDYTFCCAHRSWAEDDRIYSYQSEETKILVNILKKNIRFRINGKDFTINAIDSLKLAPYLELETDQEGIYPHYTLPATRIEHEETNFKFAMEINNIGIEKDTLGGLKIEDVSFNGFVKVK